MVEAVSSATCFIVRLSIIFFALEAVGITFSCHLVIRQIFVIRCDLVDQLAAGYDLHDAVRRCLDDLVISGREEKDAREFSPLFSAVIASMSR